MKENLVKRHDKLCRVCGIDLTTQNMYKSSQKKSDWRCKECHYEQKDNHRRDKRLRNTMLYVFWADDEPIYIGSSSKGRARILEHIKGKSHLKRDIDDWRDEGLTKISYHIYTYDIPNSEEYDEEELKFFYGLFRDKTYTLEYCLIRLLEPRLNQEYNRYCDFKFKYTKESWERYAYGFSKHFLRKPSYWTDISIDELELM